MVRILPETVRRGEFRRKALTPMADGRSRWGYPTTFLMERPTGFRQAIAIPRLGEKVSRSTWQTFLGLSSKRPTDGGHEAASDYKMHEQEIRLPNNEYHAGKQLTDAEHRACRNHRPESLNDGRFL